MFQVAFQIAKRRGAAFTIRAFGRTRAQAVARFARRLNACAGACEMASDTLCAGSKLYASVTHNGAACERVRIDRFKGVRVLSVIDGNYWAYRAQNIQVDQNGAHYDAAIERQGARAHKSNVIQVAALVIQMGDPLVINDNTDQNGVYDDEKTHFLWSGLLRYAA